MVSAIAASSASLAAGRVDLRNSGLSAIIECPFCAIEASTNG
jgi:hypothetical protein